MTIIHERPAGSLEAYTNSSHDAPAAEVPSLSRRVMSARTATANFVTVLDRLLEFLRVEGRDDLARQLDTTAEFGRAALIRLKGVERQLAEGTP